MTPVRARLLVTVVATVAALGLASCQYYDVSTLASPAFGGRDAGTAGGQAARNWLVKQLRAIPGVVGANPARGSGSVSFVQPFGTDEGNVVAMLRGTELPNDYVVIGGHYDHLGARCRTAVGGDPTDHLCNGATDNAAGVSAVLAVARRLAKEGALRRTVVFALWDGEEETEVGSKYYIAHPLVPLAHTVAYLNTDLLGANLLPSLRHLTFAVGAESGGTRLQEMVHALDGDSSLRVLQMPIVFGAGRSDQSSFLAAKIPSVFYGDSTGPCYHSAQDDVGVVDFTKLARQTDTFYFLTRNLGNTHTLPTFVANTPVATYAQVVAFQEVEDDAVADYARFSSDDQATLTAGRAKIHQIVDAGAAAFSTQDVSDFLFTASTDVGLLRHLACDGYLAPG